MANIDITNVDPGHPVIEGKTWRDELLTFSGAATIKKGTILARNSSTLKLVPFVKGGSSNENGIPKAVISYEVVATGAGDIPVRVLVEGKVDKKRLVIDADGDDANIDAKVLDQLRDYGLVAEDVTQLSRYDNPQPEPSDS